MVEFDGIGKVPERKPIDLGKINKPADKSVTSADIAAAMKKIGAIIDYPTGELPQAPKVSIGKLPFVPDDPGELPSEADEPGDLPMPNISMGKFKFQLEEPNVHPKLPKDPIGKLPQLPEDPGELPNIPKDPIGKLPFVPDDPSELPAIPKGPIGHPFIPKGPLGELPEAPKELGELPFKPEDQI